MNVSRMLWPEEQAHCVGPIKIVPVTELFFHLHDSMNSTAELDHCPQLPLELSDHVIDCLHGDHQALSTCSLVCRGWLPRAQYHLFERVSLSPYNWQAFEKLMISSPHIGVLVRNLDISHKFTYHGGAPAQEVEGMTRMVEVFPMITARLHAVTRLDLCVVDIPKWIDVLTGLRTVKELRLVRCIVPTLTELAKLICAFPHLKKLKIGDLFVVEAFGEEDNEEENVDISPIALKVPSMLRPTIEALRFPSCFLWHDAPSMGLMKWLLSESLHTHIDTLEVTVSRHRDAALLRDFSQELGPGLKHLYFSLRPDNWREDLSETPMTLAHCTGLRTLGFWSLNLHIDPPCVHPHLAWVPLLLSQLNAPHLEHVHFRVRAGGAGREDLDALDWARVADILCGRAFVNLRRVTFEIFRGEGIRCDIMPHIRARMRGLEARGIVRYAHRWYEF
ncbi:hypothetical protein AcW1_008986 [Taiwanofungus camphoratus]|nr:hypothetical protein AcV5_007013 [Antrodia cinnamomea]KAI0949347.1 hypothetical protein AcW1_008986 [Antrodia cinnamomea]KAI0958837.1 hypothetical protein AcV7_004541 [Antrodia cinnamomea]